MIEDHIYNMEEIDDFLNQSLPIIKKKGKNPVEFYNVPCSFDIETTSTYICEEKIAYMYVWQFGLGMRVIIGRTWVEFLEFYQKLVEKLHLCEDRRLLCFVHNLAFEFQFIRKLFKWESVFANKERSPIYARTVNGLEFRCSYILTNCSLNELSKKLLYHKIPKMIGDLDYDLVRNPSTPLTDKELGYCVNDIKILLAFVKEQISFEDGKIYKIPLTSTGYCRRYCRDECLPKGKDRKSEFYEYRKLMKTLTMTLPEYRLAHDAFMGGFTHTCPSYSGQIVNEAGSIDFTSAYPAEIVKEKRFPMSRGRFVKIKNYDDFKYYTSRFCCIFVIEFVNIQSKVEFDNYIPIAHCRNVHHPVINNGRVYSAESLTITITEIDMTIIDQMYSYENIRVGKFVRYLRGYLPTPLVKAVLNLYEKKTVLKGTTEGDPLKENDYLRSKQLLNACFGMMCTNVITDEIVYEDDVEWTRHESTPEEDIENYNNSFNRFLFFPWGIYVTALNRLDLMRGIFEFANEGTDKSCHYIYSDTDSIKGICLKEHMGYIEKYNKEVENKLRKAMEYHGLSFDLCNPCDSKGEHHLLGMWDLETIDGYTLFKAYGSKRYVYLQDGEVHLTVAGLNKKAALPYLKEKYKTIENIMSHFVDGLTIPREYTGKLTHTYIDDYKCGYIEDYLGDIEYIESYSGTHLSSQPYEMSISSVYKEFLQAFLLGKLSDIRRMKV